MGKIKSAVITAILVAAIVVLAFFATVSFKVPGSNGVERYNSFMSSIRLGGDLTGRASAVLYPDGVISAADFEAGKPENDNDKLDKYVDKYAPFGSVYIEKEVLGEEEGAAEKLKAKVKNDAEVISARFDQKGYSDYSVAVCDDFTLRVEVPTGFTYAEYNDLSSSTRSEVTTDISRSIQYLAYNGELSLRNAEVGKVNNNNILTPITADLTTYFKSFEKISAAGNHAVKVNLTSEGREQFKTMSAAVIQAENDKAIDFYVGEAELLSLSLDAAIDEKSFYITVPNGESVAQDFAIVLNSAANGKSVTLDYKTADNLDVVYMSAPMGELAPIFLMITLFIVLAAAIVFSIVKYKKLGLVNTMMIVIYALTMITACMILEIEVTIAGAFALVLGLALVCGTNFALFEAVRRETKKGKTMQSSVKSGYKATLFGILELHAVLVVTAIMLALICVGELAACGLIFFIATVASYVLFWFTRFMWYVISSPVRDKFKFGGFTREELNDEQV